MKRVENRSRQMNWQLRQRAAGRCPIDGNRCGINPRTGRAYVRCPACRVKIAAIMKLKMRRRRAAGLAR